MLATTILRPGGAPGGALQTVHFDVVLPHLEDERLLVPGALARDEENQKSPLARVESWLAPHVKTFAGLFEPRTDKRRSSRGGEAR